MVAPLVMESHRLRSTTFQYSLQFVFSFVFFPFVSFQCLDFDSLMFLFVWIVQDYNGVFGFTLWIMSSSAKWTHCNATLSLNTWEFIYIFSPFFDANKLHTVRVKTCVFFHRHGGIETMCTNYLVFLRLFFFVHFVSQGKAMIRANMSYCISSCLAN